MTFETSSRLGSQHFALLRLGAKGPQRFGCCIVGVFEARPWRRIWFGQGSQEVQHWPGQVGPGYVEPAAKKAKKEGSEKAKKGMVMVEGSA